MVFTPDEVANRTFVAALRGYDKVEVDGFLRAVAADYAHLAGEVEALRAQLENKVRELDGMKPDYRQAVWEGSQARSEASRLRVELARTVLALALLAHAVRRAADEDADAIRRRAEQDAHSVVAAARRSAAALVVHASPSGRSGVDGAVHGDEADRLAALLAAWRGEQERALGAAVGAVEGVRDVLLRQREQLAALGEVGAGIPAPRPRENAASEGVPGGLEPAE